MAPTIPLYYRLFFTYFDPLVSSLTCALSFYDAQHMLSLLIPEKHLVWDENMAPLIWQLGALFGMIAILTTGLLRYTSDIGVWKIVQASIVFVDVAILGIFYGMMEMQGRLDVRAWTGNDWGNVLVTGLCAVTRGAFIAGVGLKGKGKEVKRA